MNRIIKEIFGNAIKEQKYSFPAGTPLYISAGYRGTLLSWDDKECLLVRPLNEDLSLPAIKKQVKFIESLCSVPVVIDIDRITAKQRTNLIVSGIAFVSETGQLFIPFWGCYFEEKIRNAADVPAVMTDNAQLVFLYLYYMNLENPVEINLTQLCERLALPKATCSRAVQVLDALGLMDIRSEGVAKWISLKQPLGETMLAGEQHMVTPIQKTVYLKAMPEGYNYKIGGIRALADNSMLAAKDSDGSYVVSKDEYKRIPETDFIDREEFRDFGGVIVEVWRYDPSLLSDSDYVDEISLVLSLNDENDERVQKELDFIREKYGMQVE